MYTTFYGMEGSGFEAMSDRSLRFWHESYTDAFLRLLEALRRDEGFAVLTGAPGTGKTSLINDLAARLENDGCMVGKVTNSQVSADDLLRLVGFAFGLEADALTKAGLLTKLKEQLIDKNASGQPVALLIDEAQALSVDALQQLYLLFDLIARRGHPVQILLAGQEWLWETLHKPVCEQIRKLIVESCKLLPFTPNETRAYIAQALRNIGWTGDPEISADALRVIHERTGGVPRMIRLTLGRLLLHGSLGEAHALGLSDVESVLGQLGEDHPELLLDTSIQQPLSHPVRSTPLLPLDVRAAEDIEPHRPLVQGRLLFPVKGRERVAAAYTFLGRFQRATVGMWKRSLVVLSAATVSAYAIFAISVEGDRSRPLAVRDPDGRERIMFVSTLGADQSEPERAEAPLESRAYKGFAEAGTEVVDVRNGIEDPEDFERNLPGNKSAIPGSDPMSDAIQDPLGDTPPAVAFAEAAVPVAPNGAPAERQDQADPEVGELLGKAEHALSKNRLTVPSGDNAYAYYRTVLARDPGNAQARAGVRRIVQRYRRLAEQRLRKGDRNGARRFASRGLKIWPRDRQLLAIKRKATEPRVAKQEEEVPEVLERVGKWFRSGDTSTSAFLDH